MVDPADFLEMMTKLMEKAGQAETLNERLFIGHQAICTGLMAVYFKLNQVIEALQSRRRRREED